MVTYDTGGFFVHNGAAHSVGHIISHYTVGETFGSHLEYVSIVVTVN